jgi:hypothetical protein
MGLIPSADRAASGLKALSSGLMGFATRPRGTVAGNPVSLKKASYHGKAEIRPARKCLPPLGVSMTRGVAANSPQAKLVGRLAERMNL